MRTSRGTRFEKVQNPRRAGSLEKDQPLSSHAKPLKPRPRMEPVGSVFGRRARRAEVARQLQGGGGESPGGANTQEGKVRRISPVSGFPVYWCLEASFPFLISEKPLKSRRFRIRARPGNDKRGESPRGEPRVGWSKALKEEPHECCCGRRAVAKRSREQTVERVLKP